MWRLEDISKEKDVLTFLGVFTGLAFGFFGFGLFIIFMEILVFIHGFNEVMQRIEDLVKGVLRAEVLVIREVSFDHITEICVIFSFLFLDLFERGPRVCDDS